MASKPAGRDAAVSLAEKATQASGFWYVITGFAGLMLGLLLGPVSGLWLFLVPGVLVLLRRRRLWATGHHRKLTLDGGPGAQCRVLRRAASASGRNLDRQAVNGFPVSRWYASTYFARVAATTSSGSGGGGRSPARSQPDSCSSQLRTYCLS